uniref:Uncharacterized protein n=1 Tax=viral metagenome TaxID=1070528 RepID=A0A6C0BKS1_9ZZZZ
MVSNVSSNISINYPFRLHFNILVSSQRPNRLDMLLAQCTTIISPGSQVYHINICLIYLSPNEPRN